MQNGCDYSVGACYSPAGSDKIRVVDFSFHQGVFACACLSRRLCYGSHSSVTVGHNLLDEVILFIQHHMEDVMMKVTFSTDVTSLATALAGLRKGFESECSQHPSEYQGEVCMKERALLQGVRWWGHVNGGRRMECVIGEGAE
jgi:hypothetical protein